MSTEREDGGGGSERRLLERARTRTTLEWRGRRGGGGGHGMGVFSESVSRAGRVWVDRHARSRPAVETYMFCLGRWGCRAGRVRVGWAPARAAGGAHGGIKRLACDPTRRRGARVRGEEGGAKDSLSESIKLMYLWHGGWEGRGIPDWYCSGGLDVPGGRDAGARGAAGGAHARARACARRSARCQTAGSVPELADAGGAGDESGDGGDAWRRGGAGRIAGRATSDEDGEGTGLPEPGPVPERVWLVTAA